jgi:hypothetical protein
LISDPPDPLRSPPSAGLNPEVSGSESHNLLPPRALACTADPHRTRGIKHGDRLGCDPTGKSWWSPAPRRPADCPKPPTDCPLLRTVQVFSLAGAWGRRPELIAQPSAYCASPGDAGTRVEIVALVVDASPPPLGDTPAKEEQEPLGGSLRRRGVQFTSPGLRKSGRTRDPRFSRELPV